MKILVLSCAALGAQMFRRYARHDVWSKLNISDIQSPFPALTCPVQASFRTAAPVSVTGTGASGYFDRPLRKAFFWEQSSGIFDGRRFWEDYRKHGGYVGQICLQECPGPESDLYLSPGPVHKHHGGMIQAFYSKPEGLYEDICAQVGMKFNLMHYWGPFTSYKGTEWIARATCDTMRRLSGEHPDCLLLSYLPHLDYAAQKYGPDTPQAARAFAEFEQAVAKIAAGAKQYGFSIVIFGDYEIGPVGHAIAPNTYLRKAGYLLDRKVGGMSYLNLHSSRAFALADHQVCHIYVFDPSILDDVWQLAGEMPGIARRMLRDSTPELNHPRCGEIILEAEADAWFAYRWWDNPSEAPDFATHVDIHNKPGFDPLELFCTVWPPFGVSQDESLLRGSHGRTCEVALATDLAFPQQPASIVNLAEQIRSVIEA